MNRSILSSALKKLLVSLFSSSLLIACSGSGAPTETPKMTYLDLMPNSEIKEGENLVVNSDCELCDRTKTRYEWKVEGVDRVVSYDDYYRIPAEYVAREISVTATALDADWREGSFITRTYALNRVKEIVGSHRAFAALKLDGTVVVWGDSSYGGDSSSVAKQLSDVQSISATEASFSAIKADGSIVTWGNPVWESDNSEVSETLLDVQFTSATSSAFAKINDDGSVETWGDSSTGGDSGEVADQLTSVQSISATETAFAAIKADGSVITWGSSANGGDSSAVVEQLTNIKSISSTGSAFAAIKADGSVVLWGDSVNGGFIQESSVLEPRGIIILK